ncbi:MAG: hypothetical protein ACRDYC_02050 [Acidimicrobiales bacterium]
MSEVSSRVEVPVDPATAFKVFTEEIDLWWVRGPINFYSAGRAAAMGLEAGVGGRLLEVYDDSTGDALERGVITVWEPGERLAWDSTGDDVQTEVLFKAMGEGTLVEVVARVPEGGVDRGGTAWVRVVPWWFGALGRQAGPISPRVAGPGPGGRGDPLPATRRGRPLAGGLLRPGGTLTPARGARPAPAW